MDITDHFCRIKVTLGEESQRLQDRIKSTIKNNGVKISSGQIFHSFEGRGKYKEVIFDYDAETYSLVMHISKTYFVEVLRLEEYELLIIGRHLVTLLEEFLAHIRQFVMLMIEHQKTKICEIYSIDVISITISKNFNTHDTNDHPVSKKIFLR